MRVLVIGLGSMGTRRIRNLQALKIQTIAGFDIREDRRNRAANQYGINVFSDWIEALEKYRPDALVISTSPEHHMTYAEPAAGRNIPCFIEASVVDTDRILALYQRIEGTSLVMAPSCTMRFFPGPRMVKELIQANKIGRVLNVNYQTGQYLPDWHPWESIEDYYVSDRETGGGREIVPFELTWLNDIFGQPEPLACVKAKLSDMPAEIDDVYHCILRYPENVILNMTVEVISRPHATRELRVLGSEGEIIFSADENCVRYASSENSEWQRFDLGTGTVETGYINPEEPYIAEMKFFLEAARKGDQSLFPNSLYDDYLVLRALEKLEKIAGA